MSIQHPIIRCVVVGINHWEDLTHPFVSALVEHNPELDVVLIDNHSELPYPSADGYWTVRTDRLGYGSALNVGAWFDSEKPDWDWLLCCNNDCLCEGEVTGIINTLDRNTIYGNEWKCQFNDPASGLPAVVDSAYFLIPRKVWDHIGGFDPEMEAAFEEIEYQVRVSHAGYGIKVVNLPIVHLDLHTRYETPDYERRWEMTRNKFYDRHSHEQRKCLNCGQVVYSWKCPQCGHDGTPR